ncbi:MAG: FGGY-family carbohydrate kinase [Lawsonibacter sp.]|nr:FGGY-family carbohydrate kinase [Lawsonibacter sp.]
MGNFFMGIDIGTFSSKGVIVDGAGQILCQHTVPHGMENPRPKHYEHDAEQVWWHDFCTISKALLVKAGLKAGCIRAVGASALGCDCLPVDEACRPLRKAILYGIDARAEEEIRFLTGYYGPERVRALFGRPMSSGDIAAKILWIKNHEPEVYRKTFKFLTGSSYLAAKLTGNYTIDRYLARASFRPMYRADGSIDEALCPPVCRPDQLPQAQAVTDLAGRVTARAAAETGLAEGTPVITGTGDSCAEAISSGVYRDGRVMLQFGSTLYMNLCTGLLVEDDRVRGTIFTVPGTYTVSAGTNTAGTLTKWFRDSLFPDLLEREAQGGSNAYAAMTEGLADISPGCGGLITLPYFAGERSPIDDPEARGMIFGLTLAHTRGHLYRSALEGIGFGVDQIFQVLRDHEIHPARVIAAGGGAQNRVWMQIVSDILGEKLHIPQETVGASYGDALMAAIGCGARKDFDSLDEIVKIRQVIHPNMEHHRAYAPYKELFRQLYLQNRELMHQLP